MPRQWALLELTAPGRLEEELEGIDLALRRRSIDAQTALLRHVQRGQRPLETASLVAGRLPFVHLAMQRLGIRRPQPLDYVDAPDSILGRRVWPSTLGKVADRLDARGEHVFIKPRGVTKRFTGRVVTQPRDLQSLRVTSPSTPVWCSEVVDIVSEHRAFVCNGRVVGLRQYDGDTTTAPLPSDVLTVVNELTTRLPAGCAVDLGTTATGATVLIEANDGYSLGRYGLEEDAYLDLLQARWSELLASR